MFFDLKLNKIIFLLLVVMVFFTACQKDQVLEPEPPANTADQQANFIQLQNQSGANADGNESEMLCFTFAYPIQIIFPDGTTQAANSDEELEVIVETWMDQNPNSEDFPTLDFPVQVIKEDGTTQTVNDEETLCELVEECWDDDDLYGDSLDIDLDLAFCFDFVYPVELVLPDGTTQMANDDDEMVSIIVGWFEANPDSEDFPTFTYPIEVIVDETTQAVNSDEEMEALFEECEHDDDYDLCFDITYPVQVIFPDGSTADVNSDEELYTEAENWYVQNPSSMDDPTFAYPIEVRMEDGSTRSIANDEELDALFEECFDDECEFDGERLLLGGHQATLTRAVIQRN